jgi:polyhydroxyalkanoate synthesis regulator phasin
MDKAELQKLAGIITEESYGLRPMTLEVMGDVKKAVSHFYDRLLTDEKMSDQEARHFMNRLLKSLM